MDRCVGPRDLKSLTVFTWPDRRNRWQSHLLTDITDKTRSWDSLMESPTGIPSHLTTNHQLDWSIEDWIGGR